MSKVIHFCRNCLNPVTGSGCTSLDIGVNANLNLVNKFYYLFCYFAFIALTLLVGEQERHLACKKLSGGVLAWLSVCHNVEICIWYS